MHNPGASPEGTAFGPTHAAPPEPHLRFPEPARPQFNRRGYASSSTAPAQSRSSSHASPNVAPGKLAQNPDRQKPLAQSLLGPIASKLSSTSHVPSPPVQYPWTHHKSHTTRSPFDSLDAQTGE
ncbi:hypothetical protein QFC20_006676 [Naganishia adeliensis]|uniref:Uncharacterized protein n=1 Tax=Naganishia adeliensis TaxID=92952 RepID=A0ACC2V7P7_9TREE|nr:hypothetical protein QFC20_006676 [Naganishia adeliensis]